MTAIAKKAIDDKLQIMTDLGSLFRARVQTYGSVFLLFHGCDFHGAQNNSAHCSVISNAFASKKDDHARDSAMMPSVRNLSLGTAR